jgi:DNA polymerase/3'-5' exonuclease PolX
MNDARPKFPRAVAIEVVKQLHAVLTNCVERISMAGSLHRGKLEVKDAEIVYIPRFCHGPATELFGTPENINLEDETLNRLLKDGILAKRKNVKGSEMWGPQNKLAIHVKSGLPIDLFSTTEECWFNYLVCRIGPAESNTRIAAEAKKKRWKWNPYGPGFTDENGNIVKVTSQEDVFRLVGLPYQEPHKRR